MAGAGGERAERHRRAAGRRLVRDIAAGRLLEKTTTTAADGTWSVEVPVQGGAIVLDVVATSPQGATAHVQRTVVFDVTPGEVQLDVTDPTATTTGRATTPTPPRPSSGRAPTTSSGSRSSTTAPT